MTGNSTASPWKGKAKLVEQDFDELNPPITYRHILSQNLGVRDPLRVIALCDSDAFYAACEMVRLKTPPDTPLVVLQWDALIAVNYPARKYGISRMDKLKDAKKRCPHLVVVHVATYKEGEPEPKYWDKVDTNTHKVSLDYYRSESAKVAAMFKECLPECEIEKASIDEAFFDFTRSVRRILLERYPHLAEVPPDAPHGVDTVLPPPSPILLEALGYVIPVNPARQSSAPPPNNQQTTDKDGAETEENGGTSGSSTAAAEPYLPGEPSKQELGEEVEGHEEGDRITTWHDIALSIAAELMQKARKDVFEKLGYSTSAGIARNKFLAKLTASCKKPNSQSILRNAAIPKYLRPIPFQRIRFLGGKLGKALAEEFEASTVGDLLTINLDELQHRFGEESIWVYEVLRGIDHTEVKEKSIVNKSMMASKNLPKAITQASEGYHWIRVLAAELALRLNNARQTNPNLWPKTLVLHVRKHSKQAPFPFTREVTVDVVASAGNKLWKELIGDNADVHVTYVALGFTGIDIAEVGQQSIESFLRAGKNSKRPRMVDEAENEPRTVETSSLDLPSISYTCAKCGRTLTVFLDDDMTDNTDPLEIVKREHDDFHFAQELAKDLTPLSTKESSPRKRKGTKRRREEPKGIEKFFIRK
ncbi:hypothetical protein AX15_005827 [Amanita polypyramis BW_CC]|nr:hypothetical protein AX15_005827 [Amanita polypyramis BW_CC]